MTYPRWAAPALAMFLSACLSTSVPALASSAVPLTPEAWQIEGKGAFVPTEGFPHGLLHLDDATAKAKGLTFADGTIDYDAKLLADGFAAIRFRTQDDRSAEIFYLRPDTECPAADDCIQYVPRVHGVWPWEMYPEYQASAPVVIGAWNHVRLVVSGRRMNVFVNGASTPTLAVGHLESDTRSGGLEFAGPAEFANLTITPGTGALPPGPAPDPTDHDPNFLRHWEVSPPMTLPYGQAPSLSGMPASPDVWTSIAVERHGLVDLSRRYGSPTDRATGAAAWLRTSITSDRDRNERVSFGFLHEAWVFVNGRMVFTGENLYYPEAKRLAPDGRLSLDNAAFELPLRAGRNEIAIALNNILAVGHLHYGWGLELRLSDLRGLLLPKT